MIQLGRRRGSGPAPLAEIADAENLPLPYLEHLVARLRKAGLVASTRGAHGGYEVARAPEDITMAEVVHALEGTLVPMQCFSEPGDSKVHCSHEIDGYENCATKLMWTRVQGSVARALEQTTLAELVDFSLHGPAQPPARESAPHARRRPKGRRAGVTTATAG